MPVFTGNPQRGFVPPDNDQPQGPDPTQARQVRVRQGAQDQVQDRPHPFLLAHGFNGGIQSFNRRVQKTHDSYVSTYGREPSPGLVWDVAKSNQLLDNQIPSLFQNTPLDSRQAKIHQAHQEASWNGEGVHLREDGKVQPTNLLTAYRDQLGHNHPELVKPKSPVLSIQDFHKKYPMLMDGYSGMLPFGKTFWKDVGLANGHEAPFQQKLGLLSAKQALQVAGQAQDSQLSQQATAAEEIAGNGTQTAGQLTQAAGTIAKSAIKQSFKTSYTQAINRNKQRQDWLLKHDPSNQFAGLTANGIFDRNWMVAYDKWSRTPGAAYQMMQTVAQQNYFSPTPAGVRNMANAAKLKDKMVNDAKKWSEKYQIEATPLRFFADNSAPLGETLSPKSVGQMFKDFWKYEDTGTSWLTPVAALQGAFRFAKLGYNEMSGTFNQITADAQGTTALAGKGLPMILEGKSTKQIADVFAKAVNENPDWVRALGFGYLPEHLTGSPAFLDGVGNFVIGSAIAMMARGPGYWKIGEDAPIGAIRGNWAVQLMTRLAHSDIKAGDLWRAEQVLGPGAASRDFVVSLEKDIQSGKLDHAGFHNLATEYFKNGTVRYGDKTFNGAILRQLHSDKIPKSLTKLTLQQLGPKLRKGLDNLELQGLAHGSHFGKLSEAFVRSTRGMFGLASPDTKAVELFGDRVPGQLESFLTNHGLMDHGQIHDTVNAYIRASAHENIPEMEAILKDANSRYREKFPRGQQHGEANDFEKMLETENLTYFRFAGGGLREPKNAWDNVLNGIEQTNRAFAKVGYYWRRTILFTGPGLFYKHLTRDSVAALLGGMKFHTTQEMLDAFKTADQVMRENPELRRMFSQRLGGVKGADLSYMLGTKYGAAKGEYNLMEEIAANPKMKEGLSLQAATHLRRTVMSKAYPALQEALRTGNMEPLTRVIMENKEFRTILEERSGVAERLKMAASYGSIGPQAGDYGIETQALRNLMERQIIHKEASAYAKAMFDRYKATIDAGKEAGIPDVFDVVDQMNWDNPGAAEKKVAKYLADNGVNVRVTGGAPEPQNWFDKTTGAGVSTFMKPNKFFRGKLFEHAFAQNYSNMLKFGYDPKAAFPAAVSLAEHQTMYHMLDFSNTLQFEQRFRGFLPFFTKHRLFVKWLAGRIAQYPGIVMPVNDIGKHLDQYGRLNFTFHGVALNLNVSRLFWLNSEDMPVIIPGAQLIPKAGLPGEFTRFDSIIGAWFHGVQSNWNYKAVTSHMDQYSTRRLDKYMAIYAIKYRMSHGASAPVSEAEALKYALFNMRYFGGVTGNLLVNNAFLSPVTFSSPQTPGPIKKLDDQYSKLFNQNPAKARAFLDAHPEVGLGWGMTENFNLYNHVTQYWGKYDAIHSKFLKTEHRFANQVLAGKAMSAKDYAAMRQAQQEYDAGIQQLLVSDARSWTIHAGGYKPGQVDNSGLISNYGPWGTLFLHDPVGSVNRLIQQFGGKSKFSAAELHNIYGTDLAGLQWEIDHPKMAGLDNTSRGAAIQQLKRLEGAYKITGKPNLWQTYTSARSNYENQLFKLYDKAKTESGAQKEVTLYQARELIANNVTSSTIKFDGQSVKVLPFGDYTLTTKTPTELAGEIWGSDSTHRGMVGFSYSTLTLDQRQFLGIKTTPQIDRAWGVYNYWKASYEQQTGKTISTTVEHDYAIALNKDFPGFWRDYQIAHLPKSYALLEYAQGAFQGKYGNYWKELVRTAYLTYDKNKQTWYQDVPYYDSYIKANWPAGFVAEYQAAGGQAFLRTLNYAWG